MQPSQNQISVSPNPVSFEVVKTKIIDGDSPVAIIFAIAFLCSVLLKRLDEILKNRRN